MNELKAVVFGLLFVLACAMGALQIFVRRRIRYNATHFARAGVDVSTIQPIDRWTLAVVARYLMPLELPVDVVRPPEFRRVATLTSLLTKDWGVKDRASLLPVIDHLRFKGHRVRCAAVSGRSEEDFLAWDLMRAVLLAWAGLNLDWISRPEFVSMVTGIGTDLQNAFDAWEGTAESYEAGLVIWADEGKVRKVAERARLTLKALLDDPASPWRSTDWKTALLDTIAE